MSRTSPLPSPADALDACSDEALLEKIQYDSFHFFHIFVNRQNGLVPDSNKEDSPCSTAAVGFALSAYPIAVERGWMSHDEALALTLAALRFFDTTENGDTPCRVGHKGFFFHFLDMTSGERMNDCELSVIDTALLLAGILFSARYFDGVDTLEDEVRQRALAIYSRVDWRWMQNAGAALALAWTPEKGFSRYRWIGYCEALVLYVLALGSPTHAIEPQAYGAWLSGYRWKRIYGHS
ncbi:MAG: glucoamylase family protein, partial [Burkholderiaceae bacterium]